MAVVGAVGIVALIGDLRASGSAGLRAAGTAAPLSEVQAPVVPAARLHKAVATPPADHALRTAAPDDTQLVPAIYAWDPDVRFIYYRHVSKWM